jgi:hypothetical protein
MEKEFNNFIKLRCEDAINEYKEHFNNEDMPTEESKMVTCEKICYKRGFLDALNIYMHDAKIIK